MYRLSRRPRAALLVLTTAAFGTGGTAFAAPASIANAPLTFQSANAVRPNLMFILDDSGSMGREYMPDGANFDNKCFGYHGFNRLAYNPSLTYLPPLNADGSAFPTATWPNAKNNGFDSSSATRDLSSAPFSKGGDTFYYTTYSGSATSCPSDTSSLTNVASIPAAQQGNYANWWSYYRTRLLTMKSGVGRVFANIDATRFRVGYSTIHETGYSDSSAGFLNIRDFDTQKTTFFSKLYGQSAGSGTPLRAALEKAGRYFAGVTMGGSALPSGSDPVQYSCQRNYTLLSTDGYWNNFDGNEDAFRSGYVPRGLDNTDIGNRDNGSTPRPMLDDGQTQGSNWVTGGSGVGNTLADIAMYFYATDLRTGTCTINGQDVCANNIKPLGSDTAAHQHMTTFTLGLGVSGQIAYQSNYDDPSLTSGDFFEIRNGSRAWPNPMLAEDERRIDDLWHAAVNGRGRYYSAAAPADLVTGLTDALERVQSASGTSAAAAVSSLQPVSGDNFIFTASYTTEVWEGNLIASTIDPTSASLSSTKLWEAKDTLRAQVQSTTDGRTIRFFNSSASKKLSEFTYANLNSAGKGGLFSNLCQIGNYKLSQCGALDVALPGSLTTVNNGDNVVNYLRGRTQYEDVLTNPATSRLLRGRGTPLGDIVNAAPVYVKKPPFRYADAGYNVFATNNASRAGVVYVASNGGMLHAFNAATGTELWAYVPSMVIPNMYRLADFNYAANHRYFVDGAPVVADVHDGASWRTILVGGLNGGGRGYYALDVTDPSDPIGLWEISHDHADTNFRLADLGLSYGNPIIAKDKTGTWVVMFTSGYNNTGTGDGNGRLYVRNAVTGAAIAAVPTFTNGNTPAGDTTTPSNLGKIAVWVNSESDNTALRAYGGDMLGYVWRFDFDDVLSPNGREATLMGQAQAPSGAVQPITTRPQLFTIRGAPSVKAVAIGTGRLLGSSDSGDTTVQSLYVFNDDLSANAGVGVLRNSSKLVQQTLADAVVAGQSVRQLSNPATVDWSAKAGWFVDFNLTAGERVNVDMLQTGTSLIVAGNAPATSPCTPGGSSWTYVFSTSNGSVLDSFAHDAMVAGYNLVKTTDGAIRLIRMDVLSRNAVRPLPPAAGPAPTTLRRTSWRELID